MTANKTGRPPIDEAPREKYSTAISPATRESMQNAAAELGINCQEFINQAIKEKAVRAEFPR